METNTNQFILTSYMMAREMNRKTPANLSVAADMARCESDPNSLELTFTCQKKTATIRVPVSDLLLSLPEFSEKHIDPELLT